MALDDISFLNRDLTYTKDLRKVVISATEINQDRSKTGVMAKLSAKLGDTVRLNFDLHESPDGELYLFVPPLVDYALFDEDIRARSRK